MSNELFREVDEEVRQERFQQYWKRYGTYVAAAALVIVAATIGYVVWQNLRQAEREEASAAFIAAISADPQAARGQFEALAEDAPAGYRLLARLRAAALLADSGDPSQAVAAFDAIAADDGVDRLYRNLASLFAVANGMAILGPDEVRERIGPLDSPDSPLRFAARELLAASAMKAGDGARAKELLGAIVDDPAAPPGSRRRAAELLATLES